MKPAGYCVRQNGSRVSYFGVYRSAGRLYDANRAPLASGSVADWKTHPNRADLRRCVDAALTVRNALGTLWLGADWDGGPMGRVAQAGLPLSENTVSHIRHGRLFRWDAQCERLALFGFDPDLIEAYRWPF